MDAASQAIRTAPRRSFGSPTCPSASRAPTKASAGTRSWTGATASASSGSLAVAFAACSSGSESGSASPDGSPVPSNADPATAGSVGVGISVPPNAPDLQQRPVPDIGRAGRLPEPCSWLPPEMWTEGLVNARPLTADRPFRRHFDQASCGSRPGISDAAWCNAIHAIRSRATPANDGRRRPDASGTGDFRTEIGARADPEAGFRSSGPRLRGRIPCGSGPVRRRERFRPGERIAMQAVERSRRHPAFQRRSGGFRRTGQAPRRPVPPSGFAPAARRSTMRHILTPSSARSLAAPSAARPSPPDGADAPSSRGMHGRPVPDPGRATSIRSGSFSRAREPDTATNACRSRTSIHPVRIRVRSDMVVRKNAPVSGPCRSCRSSRSSRPRWRRSARAVAGIPPRCGRARIKRASGRGRTRRCFGGAALAATWRRGLLPRIHRISGISERARAA